MTVVEFSQVLNSLVKEYKDAAEAHETVPDRLQSIWVTTPEGIDGYREKQVVFFLGVDNQQMPRVYPEPWPFREDRSTEHREKERYLFLTVVRAAVAKLHLSYARNDHKGAYRPSLYLEAACAVLDAPLQPIDTVSMPVPAPSPSVSEVVARVRRNTYSLHEIAHFALCPYRFKMESLDTRARRYRIPFQIYLRAGGYWFERILAHLCATGETANGEDAILQMLVQTMDAVEAEVRNAFPGLREADWIAIRHRLPSDLGKVANHHGSDPDFAVSISAPQRAYYQFEEDGLEVQVDATLNFAYRKGRFLYPNTQDRLNIEWLLPQRAAQNNQQVTWVNVDGVQVFKTLYDAIFWWRVALSNAHYRFNKISPDAATIANYAEKQGDVQRIVASMEAGHYPKNPGDHCNYCPVRNECLGLVF